MIAFTPHATNGATVTLNVDGLGAKPLRPSPSVELVAGVLILGTPYVALYNNSDQVFYLQNFYINPYTVPIGAAMPYFGTTAPNSAFVLPYGQAISRTTYSSLFSLFSTTFGTGDGSTTFNIPDIRGRVVAGKDDMGGSAASRLTTAGWSIDGITLGASGGGTQTLVTANLPPYTPAGTNASSSLSLSNASAVLISGAGGSSPFDVSGGVSRSQAAIAGTAAAQTFTGTAQGGTSTPVKVAGPTIIGNYIMRVI